MYLSSFLRGRKGRGTAPFPCNPSPKTTATPRRLGRLHRRLDRPFAERNRCPTMVACGFFNPLASTSDVVSGLPTGKIWQVRKALAVIEQFCERSLCATAIFSHTIRAALFFHLPHRSRR